jgi:hypothetical protein
MSTAKDQPIILTVDQIKNLVKETVTETLTAMGVEVKDPIAMQRDLKAIRDWRLAVEAIKRKATLTAVGIGVTGVLAVLVLGIRSWLASKGVTPPPP